MRVIVTRPREEAQRWVDDLRAKGFDAIALPLIEIGPPPDLHAIREAWRSMDGIRAAMFVSGNAVRGFFAHRAAGNPFDTRAWAPGPGTRDALREAGVDAAQIDCPPEEDGQFDSEALWPRVRSQVRRGDRVLLVRGGNEHGQVAGREWLGQQVEAAGGVVSNVVAYVRRAPTWPAGVAPQAFDAAAVWLFSSTEAVANLRSLAPRQDWSQAAARATHPRIRDAALKLGFGEVVLCAPTLAAVATSLESAR